MNALPIGTSSIQEGLLFFTSASLKSSYNRFNLSFRGRSRLNGLSCAVDVQILEIQDTNL